MGLAAASELFMRLVFQLGWDYLQARRIHLIVDNFGIHESQFSKLVLASCEGKVRVRFLPPYCPDDNRIERVWRDLHDNVTRNHRCRTMDELMKEALAFAKGLNKRREIIKEMKLRTYKDIARVIEEEDPPVINSGEFNV